MATPELMKKEDLVSTVRKLTQEVKRLLSENEDLKEKTVNSVASTDSLTFDSYGLSFIINGPKDFQVHLLKYDSKTGQAIVDTKFAFDKVHMAEFKGKELLFTKIFKGGL